MIEFVPLLLGLVSGVHSVELKASVPVAQVELLLDGRSVATLEQEPWRFACDFGALAPHELKAIARDDGGREIARARQAVNMRLNPAEAALVFTGGERGQPRAVGLVWEGIGQRQPPAVEMTFDGRPLNVADPGHVPLPAYDPEEMHFVSASVRFRDDVESRLDAGFGGGRGSEVATELTAVSVTLEPGARMPRRRELAGWFLKDGEPLAVHGVERGAAEVVVVRDPDVQPALEELIGDVDNWRLRDAARHLSTYAQVGEDTYLRVMSPARAPLSPDEVTPQMFVHSESLDAEEEGLLWHSQRLRPQSFPRDFPSAVALAGIRAHAATRRRAVVLLLGDSPAGRRIRSPAAVRDFLHLLNVPFFVWKLGTAEQPEWPGALEIPLAKGSRAGHEAMTRAIGELRATLDAQRIVWLEGRHLPQRVTLAPRAEGLRLTGDQPAP